jgi:hypothetical protein
VFGGNVMAWKNTLAFFPVNGVPNLGKYFNGQNMYYRSADEAEEQ